jgi:hypothetical protein
MDDAPGNWLSGGIPAPEAADRRENLADSGLENSGPHA